MDRDACQPATRSPVSHVTDAGQKENVFFVYLSKLHHHPICFAAKKKRGQQQHALLNCSEPHTVYLEEESDNYHHILYTCM
jgi:hypothetical protein